MKTVNSAVYNAIRKNVQIEATPRLIGEWNMNRYFNPVATNTPSEDTDGFDIEHFPIDSIVAPARPGKGILKARTNEAMVTDLDRPGTSRYYTASEDDVYHYWTSPEPTLQSAAFSKTVRPQIVYSENVSINKIVVKVENFWASPKEFYIRTTNLANPTNLSDWTSVATSPTINNDGEIILYWNGTGWSPNKPVLNVPPLKTVRGIMIDVRTMGPGKDGLGNTTTYTVNNNDVATTGRYSFFNLIEISGRREVDLTSSLISVSDNLDTSASSDLFPVGTITNNTGQITLSNLYSEGGVQKTGYFNRDNTSSPYYKLMQPNVMFNLEYVYKINGTDYPVQQFKMYGGEWEGQKSHEISISLNDASKFLEQVTPPPAMYEDLTVPQIFQRLLDISGFSDWVIDEDDRNEKHTVPVFWTDGEKNTWEILDDLAQGTQTAIYFDGYGKLQVKTRWAAFNDAKTPTWTLRGENAGTELADIIEMTDEGEAGTNHVTITYQNTTWDQWNNGSPSMQKVWEPDSTVTLRGCPLVRTIELDSNRIWIAPNDAQIWPYSGIVQIEGELIKYDGKEYIYFTGPNAGTRNVAVVKSADDKTKYHNKTPLLHRGKNGFSGALKISDDDDARGYWNSDARVHSVDLGSYAVRRLVNAGKSNEAVNTNSPGVSHLRKESLLRITSRDGANGNDATIATTSRNWTTNPYKFYGTKFRFNKESGLNEQRAGLMINGQGIGNADGYFIDLIYTRDSSIYNSRYELTVFSSKNGKITQLHQGIPVAVALDTFYQIDAIFDQVGNTQRMSVMFNGRIVMTVDIPSGSAVHNPATGQFGMFVRGNSNVDFEYVYGVARNETTPDDDSTFFDLVRGGYTGDHFAREFIWGWKTKKVRKKKKWVKEKYRWNEYFFDEFGPYVHEVREFEVKFDPAPVKNSRLYMTNEWGVICTQYRSGPFGANFVLTNVSRRNEVAHGDDNITFGGDRTVGQILTAIGRILVIAEAETIVKKNENSIKVRGNVEAEISSPWIQSKKMAEDIGKWVVDHWSEGMDELSVEIFGNPLIELTDVVSVEYAEKKMTANSHRYFVTAIETNFDNGINTSLRLRRVQT